MFSNNADLNLRKAANTNNITAMQTELKNGANVNSAGKDTGLTALHRAACNGHLEAVVCLIDNGANLEILSTKTEKSDPKTAYDLAVENDRQQVADFLMLALIANDAKIHTQKFFVRNNKDTNDFLSYIKAQEEFVKSGTPEVLELMKVCGKDPQLYCYLTQYEVTGPLIVSDQRKFYSGRCGEYTRGAACYLLEYLPRTGINVSVEHFLITWQDKINHAFLVLGRNPLSDITDVKSWGNALICDADPVSKFNIHSCKKIKDTYLEKINNKSVQVEVLFSSVRPKIHPLLIEKFNNKTTAEIINFILFIIRVEKLVLTCCRFTQWRLYTDYL